MSTYTNVCIGIVWIIANTMAAYAWYVTFGWLSFVLALIAGVLVGTLQYLSTKRALTRDIKELTCSLGE